MTVEAIEAFVREFEACRLPKARWTHNAHLLVALWYLTQNTPDETLAILRVRIRAHNESVGTVNSDSSGYHETLTRLYLRGVNDHIAQHAGASLPESLAALLRSPLADKEWPLRFYSRGRLFSVAARHGWVEPDLPVTPLARPESRR